MADSQPLTTRPGSPGSRSRQLQEPGTQSISVIDHAFTTPIPASKGIVGAHNRQRRRYQRDEEEQQDDNNDEDGEVDEEGSDIDPNEFDLMLSRSLQSGVPLLGPEPVEDSMLRNTRRQSRSRSVVNRHRRRSSVATARTTSPYAQSRRDGSVTSHKRHIEADEQTPLLLSSSSNGEDGDTISTSSDGSTSNSSLSDEDITASKRDNDEDTLKTPYLGGVSPARFWVIFLQIMVVYFVACFDSTIMASSHPVITSYFGSSNSASWLSTAFLLTSTSFQPLVGGLSDAIGRRGPYLLTAVVFLVATVWCALAGSMTSFILARAACGLGAGGLMTLGSIVVSDLVPIEIRGAYQSYINITYGAGAMLGAALGGAMADYLGWRWEFGVQVPIIAIALVVAYLTIPDDLGLHGRQRQGLREAMRTFDFKGSVLMSSSITFLILGLSLGGNILPWSDPFVIASLTIFVVFFPLFLYVEMYQATKPIMPMHLVLKSPHMNLIFSNHIAAFLSNAVLFNVPLFFQAVLLTSATTSGLRLTISSAVSSCAGTATGFLITYTRRLKWPLLLGSSLVVIGTLCLSSMQRGWPAFVYMLCLVPGSAGYGFQFPGTFMAILAVADQKQQAVVTSTLILWRSLGMVLGVAVSSLILQNSLWGYLEMYVTGPEADKQRVIATVRRSVEAIAGLEERYREQVVQSYEEALRVTFLCCAALAVVSLGLLVPVKLPRLGERKV